MKHYNIPIFIPHLGCPYNCIFCNQEKITSQSQPTSNLEIQEILVSHLHTIPASSAIVEAAFFGGNFTALPREEQKKYLQAVSSFIREGRIDSIRVSTRPDYIDPEGLDFKDKPNKKRERAPAPFHIRLYTFGQIVGVSSYD
jgi:histone acetyltransferase (RNA polymerase elongator complex component)